jgi:peptidyl-prolyl cis-trans isomerase D
MIRILQQDNRIVKAVFVVIIVVAIGAMTVALVPGIFDNGTGSDATVYATVRAPGLLGKISSDSIPIKMDVVQRVAQQQLQQQHLPPMYMPLILPRIEQQQVMRAVLQREADRMGLQVSDADLVRELKQGTLGSYLFPDGNYIGDDKYMDFVQQNFGVSVAEFEQEVKSDIEIEHLRQLVSGGVTVSDAAVRKEYMEQGTKVKFDYAVISSADVKKTINPSDSDLEAFFKQNAARYATAVPETRKIAFFSFDSSNLPGGKPAVSDSELQTYYDAHAAQYTTPDEVKARHILISVPKGADAKTDAAAKAKAEDVLKQIKAGGNFADLAKKYSDDPGSKDSGGELGGMVPAANFVPPFAKAAMALNPGQTSDLVRTDFGYHIIQTEQKQVAGKKSLADVKASIIPQIEAQKSAAAAQAYATQLAAEAKKSGMQKTADAHSLHLNTTDFIARDGVIGSLPDASTLLSSAFGAAKGAAPETASTGEGYAVFQVVDIKAAHAPEFADYKSHIADDYRAQKTPELLNQQLQKLADRAKVLNDLKKAAAEMNLPLKSSDLVGRDGQVPDIGALTGPAAVVFSLPKGGISGPINEGANGAVLQLTDKQEPTADDIAKNLPATREKMKSDLQNESFGVFASTLLDRYTKAGAIVYSKKQDEPGSLLGKSSKKK